MLKRKKLIAVWGSIAVVLFSLVAFIRSQYVLPITMYHSLAQVSPPGNRLVVSVAAFERQMAFLKKHGYNVMRLEDAVDLIRDKKKFPPRAIALTFDDGNKDNYTYAFPILKKYNFPATMFIIVSQVGRENRLNWTEIKEMQDSGLITIGSHTITHPLLEYVSSDGKLRQEIRRSKEILEKKLGKAVNIFSYTAGRFNSRVRQFVIDAGYKAAVSGNPGKKYPNDDVFALKRLRISENAGNPFIFWAETNGYYNFIREHRHK